MGGKEVDCIHSDLIFHDKRSQLAQEKESVGRIISRTRTA